ncbi:MAG: MutS-related protein [Steroidobacteraceae bacterium]
MAPADEYSSRLASWEAQARRSQALEARLGAIRLGLAALFVAAAWGAVGKHAFSALWLLAPAAAFVAAVLYHASVRRRHRRATRAIELYRGGLARLEDRWAGGGDAGERFLDPHHVYSADLDLFGRGGLFELVCAARTRMGEEALARWLLAPASREEIETRHACIRDLRDRLDLREDLAILGDDAQAGVQPRSLLEWAETPNVLEQPWIRWAARLLPGLCAAAAAFWALSGNLIPFVAVVLAEVAVLYALKDRLKQVLDPTEGAFQDLRIFGGLLARLEREAFEASQMIALVRSLASGGAEAARSIGRLSTLAELAGSRDNMIVRAVSVLVVYSLLVALAAERWRRAHGRKVRGWIETAGRLEALSSLARYAFEHPEDPLPRLVAEGAPRLAAVDLGHPLLPAARCVRNDVDLSGRTRVLLVSGSNMSGKSTLLRAVGINTVLAMAGAPVRARSLELTPLQVGTSIRISDSLAEGSSHFYAELKRLEQLRELSERGAPLGLPLLFLLDEVLQGTNSKDRRIGAEAIVRAFGKRGGIGLMSTHDLALTEIEGLEPGSLRNVHFQDEIENGIMRFDFKLRDGVVEKSNGLALMRSIGLEV